MLIRLGNRWNGAKGPGQSPHAALFEAKCACTHHEFGDAQMNCTGRRTSGYMGIGYDFTLDPEAGVLALRRAVVLG